MVLNVEKVITFMIDRNIRMHETLADGKRLVLSEKYQILLLIVSECSQNSNIFLSLQLVTVYLKRKTSIYYIVAKCVL